MGAQKNLLNETILLSTHNIFLREIRNIIFRYELLYGGLHCDQWLLTVNSEIFARVLFSRNFAYAKFRENKILTNWRNHSNVVY